MPDLSLPHHSESLPGGLHFFQPCPPLSLLRASIEDVLPSEIAADVSGHIDTCTVCQMLLTDLEAVPPASLTSVERARIRHQIPIAPPAHRSGWHWHATSAAAIALVVVAIAFLLRQPGSNSSSRPVTQSHPASSSTESAAQSAASPIQIARLAPPLDLSPALVLRGEASTAQPNAQQLAPAFAAYTQGDYALAAERFKILTDQFPRSETPFLYLGITQLLQNNEKSALPTLARADFLARQNHGAQRDDAAWYHALAAVAAQSADASDLLDSICERKQSPYSHQACELRESRK